MSKPSSSDAAAPPRLLTTEEVAAWLQVDPKTVRALTADGRLPAIRLGRRVLRFDPKDVAEMIETARTREPSPPTSTGRGVIPPSERIVPWSERRGLPIRGGKQKSSER